MKTISRFIVIAIVIAGTGRFQLQGGTTVSRAQPMHPAPGASIVHFVQVDTGVYAGSKPKNDADFRFLRSKHVKYILNVRFLPFLSGSEAGKAKKYGIGFLSVPMNASPIAPEERHVNRILRIMRDKRFQPIYLHCVLGRDRTSLIAALYDMYFLGMSQQQAAQKMRDAGLKDWWILRGLKTYFDKHPTAPPELRSSTAPN